MDNKHLVWVVPMLLIVGFILGYVSGLNIPKDISIGLDNDTLKIYDKMLDVQRMQYNSSSHLDYYPESIACAHPENFSIIEYCIFDRAYNGYIFTGIQDTYAIERDAMIHDSQLKNPSIYN